MNWKVYIIKIVLMRFIIFFSGVTAKILIWSSMFSLIIQVRYNNSLVLFNEKREAINTAAICANPIDFISPKTGIIRLYELDNSAKTEPSGQRCCLHQSRKANVLTKVMNLTSHQINHLKSHEYMCAPIAICQASDQEKLLISYSPNRYLI